MKTLFSILALMGTVFGDTEYEQPAHDFGEDYFMTDDDKFTENLFSYGTLQYETVQESTFGRQVSGHQDSLPGYYLKKVKITDPDVIEKSGEDVHSIIYFSGNHEDQIPGMVLKITPEELAHADSYEVDDYKRVKVQLVSGISAWVYVSVDSQDQEL